MLRQILPPLILLLLLAAPALAAEPPPATSPTATPAATSVCLDNRDIRSKVVSAENGYYARTSKGWWRNTGAACPAYGDNRVLITRSNINRQCRGDMVEVYDNFSRISYGSCVLGSWERIAGDPPKAK